MKDFTATLPHKHYHLEAAGSLVTEKCQATWPPQGLFTKQVIAGGHLLQFLTQVEVFLRSLKLTLEATQNTQESKTLEVKIALTTWKNKESDNGEILSFYVKGNCQLDD